MNSSNQDNEGIKVVGVGWGRTGTFSLKTAFEELGFGPGYNMKSVTDLGFYHADAWNRKAHGEDVDLREIFKGFQSMTEFPTCYYYKEMMALYSKAKFVLTTRDPDRWYNSAKETIFVAMCPKFPASIMYSISPVLNAWREMSQKLVVEGLMKGKINDRAGAIREFLEWQEEIKRNIPADRLLIFDVKQGWAPLCKFLEVPVPDTPFPYVNDAAEFKQHTNSLTFQGWVVLLVFPLLIALFLWIIS